MNYEDYYLAAFRLNETKCFVCRRVMSAMPFSAFEYGFGGAAAEEEIEEFRYVCCSDCRESYVKDMQHIFPTME